MSRHVYIVSYDVTSDKRRREIVAICCGYGVRLQYSVFRCHLDRVERLALEARLRDEINHAEDRVLIVDVGPLGGRADQAFRSLGRAHVQVQDGPTIL